MPTVLITGSTGYLGSRLTKELIRRGIDVHAQARRDSIDRIVPGATPVIANPLDANRLLEAMPRGGTVVHLVGVPHPAPWKERAFREIDLVAARAAISAAKSAGVAHFVYVSVAHPAPIMRAYVAVRRECESLLEQSGIPFTIIRPWYVLGPGHNWPMLLKPLYAIGEQFSWTAATCKRLGLVSLHEMVMALAAAVQRGAPEQGNGQIWDVPRIREFGGQETAYKGADYATTGSVRNLGRSDGSAV